jgi:Pyruvate/2-oxoacid:ferredoxin oxidoreductase delta subunit
MSSEQGAYIERQTISIDESKCTGCGTCASACAEGVIAVIDGVARVVNQDHCDGLGVCVGECPQGAISFITVRRPVAAAAGGGCPLWDTTFDKLEHAATPAPSLASTSAPAPPPATAGAAGRATPNWPIKLRLTPPDAPWLRGADIGIWADCAGFASPGAAQSAVAGNGTGGAMIIGCPKFDDRQFYLDRLTDIFRVCLPRSVSIYHMAVSCCGSMIGLVKQAQEAAGTNMPITAFRIDMDGTVSSGRSV